MSDKGKLLVKMIWIVHEKNLASETKAVVFLGLDRHFALRPEKKDKAVTKPSSDPTPVSSQSSGFSSVPLMI